MGSADFDFDEFEREIERATGTAGPSSSNVRQLNGRTQRAIPRPSGPDLPLSLDAWLARDLPEPDFLMGSWLSTTSRELLIAPTGLGKTNFVIALGLPVADGKGFLHWQGRRKSRVLYIDGEMSRRLLKKRLADAVRRYGFKPAGFLALSHEDVPGWALLNTLEGQAAIEAVISRMAASTS